MRANLTSIFFNARRLAWFAWIPVLSGLLAACIHGSYLTIGMAENNRQGHWQASYTTFTGAKRDTIRAQAGETLVLEYEVEAGDGILEIRVEDPDDEVLWEETFQEDAADTVRIPLEEGGRYGIAIDGQYTRGGWDLNWETE